MTAWQKQTVMHNISTALHSRCRGILLRQLVVDCTTQCCAERITCCKVGRLCGSTRGSGPEPVVKHVAQAAQAEAEVLQGNWSGGGHCCPWGSSLQQWGNPGLSHDRKSSNQLAGGSAMNVLPGSRAAALTCMSPPLVPVNPSLTVQSAHSKAANADKLLEERMQTLPAFDSEQVQYQNRDAALRLGLLAAKIVSSASA